jgi:hypothetical protein
MKLGRLVKARHPFDPSVYPASGGATPGAVWVARDSTRKWSGVAMDSTGQNQIACAYNQQATSPYPALSDSVIYSSSDYGHTWTPDTLTRKWSGVGMSADGTVQIAGTHHSETSSVGSGGRLYYKTGGVWTLSTFSTTGSWFLDPFSVTSNGSIATAIKGSSSVSGQLYFSTDGGNNWTLTSFDSNTSTGARSARVSADGTALICTDGTIIFRADTMGDLANTGWTAMASGLTMGLMSSSGNSLITATDVSKIITSGDDGAGNWMIYYSTDFGDNWVPLYGTESLQSDGITHVWCPLALSDDGLRVVVKRPFDSAVKYSIDGGTTWTTITGASPYPTGSYQAYNSSLTHIVNVGNGIGSAASIHTSEF